MHPFEIDPAIDWSRVRFDLPRPVTVQIEKKDNQKNCQKKNPLMVLPDVKMIRHNGRATIVFWEDGTKTVVRCGDGEAMNDYTAFTAAVCKKLFGSTTKVQKIVREKDEVEQRRVAQAKKEARAAEELAARQRREKAIVKRMARQIRLQNEAEKMARITPPDAIQGHF